MFRNNYPIFYNNSLLISSNMLSLLLGPDGFSKREYIHGLALENKADMQIFSDVENLPNADNLVQQDLFAKPKVFVLEGLIGRFNQPEIIEKFIASKNHIVIEEAKLDKRLAENKQLLANEHISIKQFDLPHGIKLNQWLVGRVKFYKGNISSLAVEKLAVALGRDNAKETKVAGKIVSVEEVYNLWQADSEIRKLISYSADKEISEQDVAKLVPENLEVDVFDLTNAIADGQKQKAISLLHQFLFSQTGSDEKGGIIQLNALLSEQFRNVAMTQDFLASKKSETEILETTGWKSGRLFIMKKNASRFPAKKILEFLNKLAALDEELKTSQTPPKVLLDLIVAQLL